MCKHVFAASGWSRTMQCGGTLVAGSIGRVSIHKLDWGRTIEGYPTELYTLANADLTLRITNYGARVVGVQAPDRWGQTANVVLGYKALASYEADTTNYLGATVGRYGNRIAKGAFQVDGNAYQIPLNDEGNALHGGPQGFDRKVWSVRDIDPCSLELRLVSSDDDMGFPGQLTVHVRYTLRGKSLRIEYAAITTKPTVLNLTNHAYFNLSGDSSKTVLDQEVMIDADQFTPTDKASIPIGELRSVAGTPFDFRQLTSIGARIGANDEQLEFAGGYDQNYVLNGTPGEMRRVAFARDAKSGRVLTVFTTEPGVQFYSGNSLKGAPGMADMPYRKHAGFCLETQHYPDSPNHPQFPSTVLEPGRRFRSATVLLFDVEGKSEAGAIGRAQAGT
jgi:aldose 1-epimerase